MANEKLIVELRGDASSLMASLKAAGVEVNRFEQKAKSAGSGIADVFGGNLASSAVATLSSAFVDGARAVVQYSAKMEQTKIGFETLMGGAVAANRHLDELKKFAAETPFEFEGLTAASRRFQNVGLSAQRVVPIMTAVGDAVAAAGGSSETLDRVTLAISQIQAKSKVSAEEINQLAEAGVGGWRILSDQLGKSTADVMKLAEQGKISSDVFLQAFENFSKQNYGDSMKRQSKTFSGALSTIQDTIMTASSTAFEPLYEKFSGLAVEASEKVQAQGDDFNAVGVIIGEYLVAGATAAVAMGAVNISSALARNVKSQFTENPETFFPMKFAEVVSEGFAKGLGYEVDLFGKNVKSAVNPALQQTDDVLKKIKDSASAAPSLAKKMEVEELNKHLADTKMRLAGLSLNFGGGLFSALSAATIDPISDALREMAKNAGGIPNLADQMKAAKAEEETQKLSDVVMDLTSEIAFFGQESEVAATKQALINKGIYDFTSAQARSALAMAKSIDFLKAQKKAFDEYNSKLQDAGKHLRDLRAEAQFELQYPKANELQKFDFWVQRNASGFASLTPEIERTRAAIRNLTTAQGALIRGDAYKGLKANLQDVLDQLNPEKKDEFAGQIRNFLGSFGLSSKDEDEIIAITRKHVTRMNETMAKARNDAERDWIRTTELDLAQAALRKFKSDKGVQVFADNAPSVLEDIVKLYKALSDTKLQSGVKTLESLMESLGLRFGAAGEQAIGAKTEIEKLNDVLADPEVTRAIEKQAAAVGYTAEQYKAVIRAKAENNADPRARGTRPRVVGAKAETGGFADGAKRAIFGESALAKIQSEADYIKAVYHDLGATTGDIIGNMVGAAGSLLEQWILTGEASGAAMAQMAASVISGLAVQAGVKAIFETAEGFAAAASFPFNPDGLRQAAMHFTAAKIYGAVALGAVGTGLAIGAAGGLQGGGSGKSGGSSSETGKFNPYSEQKKTEKTNYVRDDRFLRSSADPMRDQMRSEIRELASSVGTLSSKLSSVKPGDILVAGSNQKPGYMANVVTKELSKNSTQASKIGRVLGQS